MLSILWIIWNQKKNLPFEIQAFTTAESLIAYGKRKSY